MTERPMCGNPGHTRPVPAVARLTWPGERFEPTTACASDRDWMIREAIAERQSILIEPVLEAYGICPVCHCTGLLRADGTLRAHTWLGPTCEGRGREPKETTR